MPSRQITKWILIAFGAVLLSLLSGAGGALLTQHMGTSTYTLSYSDFVVIMLTAISVLMTILAIIIAVVGVVSWTTISSRVKESAERYLTDGFSKGNHLYVMLQEKSQAAVYSGVDPVDTGDQDERDEYNDEDEQ